MSLQHSTTLMACIDKMCNICMLVQHITIAIVRLPFVGRKELARLGKFLKKIKVEYKCRGTAKLSA